MSTTSSLTHRAAAVLRAVAAGRAELTLRCGPTLRIDGLHCCDQLTARDLVSAGFVRPSGLHQAGQWVRAELTALGRYALTPTLADAS